MVKGPTHDQSTSINGGKSGGYAFIDSSWPRKPGDRARLRMALSLQTEADQPLCLSFYVNMFGSGLGSLSVLLEEGSQFSTNHCVKFFEEIYISTD